MNTQSLSPRPSAAEADSLALAPNFLLEWPADHSPRVWAAIFGASSALAIFSFFTLIQLASMVSLAPPERRVIVRHIPLYMPPDLLTQKAPNHKEVSKTIDLASLMPQAQSQAQRPSPAPSVKHFEAPKQVAAPQAAKNTPTILPEAPKIVTNQPVSPPPGVANGLPVAAAPPPPQSSGPFQNIGSEAPPNPHPTLAPPKAGVQEAINGLAHNANSNRLIVSDNVASEPSPGAPGMPGQLAAPHAAVELQSDAQGADFKPYLLRILAIVKSNWRRVIPESARMGSVRGRTVLQFIIERDGSIPKMVTADSSGSEPLDRAAIAGLSMSNPLPPLPADYKGFQVRLAFTFSYNMPSQ